MLPYHENKYFISDILGDSASNKGAFSSCIHDLLSGPSKQEELTLHAALLLYFATLFDKKGSACSFYSLTCRKGVANLKP